MGLINVRINVMELINVRINVMGLINMKVNVMGLINKGLFNYLMITQGGGGVSQMIILELRVEGGSKPNDHVI